MSKISEKVIKEVEGRLKANKMKGPEALEMLAKVLPLLRLRTKKLGDLTLFLNGVDAEDRLYVSAWGVWRRKEGLMWVRANAPLIKTHGTPTGSPPPPSMFPPKLKVGIRVNNPPLS